MTNVKTVRTFSEMMACVLAGEPCNYIGDDSGLLEDLDVDALDLDAADDASISA